MNTQINKNQKRAFLTLAGSCFLLLTACVDDQRNLNDLESRVVHPPMSPDIDYQKINSNHKVLTAIFDSGVDYSHPLLLPNIHFDLDKESAFAHGSMGSKYLYEGQARDFVGIGYDFVGEDKWPSPYIARTAYRDEKLKKDLSPESLETQKKSIEGFYALKKLIKREPKLGFFIDPRREVTQEHLARIYHGTHVAGLMSYDRSDIGIIPYRIYPRSFRGNDYDSSMASNLSFQHAVEDAARKGVRIINISMNFAFDGSLLNKTVALENSESIYLNMFVQVIKRHPQILFVAAAGNEGVWSDGIHNLNVPCGFNLKNVLCVGNVDKTLSFAKTSSIPLHKKELVFSYGENINSFIPLQYCPDLIKEIYDNTKNYYKKQKEHQDKNILSKWKDKWVNTDGINQELLAEIDAKNLFERCSKRVGFGKTSGTSMAAPFVARLAAIKLIEHPEITDAEELISAVMADSIKKRMGNTDIFILPAPEPSWEDASSVFEVSHQIPMKALSAYNFNLIDTLVKNSVALAFK